MISCKSKIKSKKKKKRLLCYQGRERARLGQNVCEPVPRRGIVKGHGGKRHDRIQGDTEKR
jgi:hypothetical protein